MLYGVWVRDGGLDLVYFWPDGETYEKYMLDSPGSKTYTSYSKGQYVYNSISKRLYIGTTAYDVIELQSNSLIIQNNSHLYTFSKGGTDILPDLTDVRNVLIGTYAWISKDSKRSHMFVKDGNCNYIERTSKSYGSFGPIVLSATGTFSVSGNKLTVYYDDIYWEFSDTYPNIFYGWTAGGTKRIEYIVSVEDPKTVKFTDSSGYSEYFYAY